MALPIPAIRAARRAAAMDPCILNGRSRRPRRNRIRNNRPEEVSIETIRYFEKVGLLDEPDRTERGIGFMLASTSSDRDGINSYFIEMT